MGVVQETRGTFIGDKQAADFFGLAENKQRREHRTSRPALKKHTQRDRGFGEKKTRGKTASLGFHRRKGSDALLGRDGDGIQGEIAQNKPFIHLRGGEGRSIRD